MTAEELRQHRDALVEFVRLGWRVSQEWEVHVPDRITFVEMLGVSPRQHTFDPRLLLATLDDWYDQAGFLTYGRRHGGAFLDIALPRTNHLKADRQASARQVIGWAEQMHADRIVTKSVTGEEIGCGPGDDPHAVTVRWLPASPNDDE